MLLKICVHALGKNLKFFHWVLLINMIFKKERNYFDEYVSRVREMAFFTLSHTLETFLSKYFFFIHVDQKYLMKQFEIFP